jgi:hypothetical protein
MINASSSHFDPTRTTAGLKSRSAAAFWRNPRPARFRTIQVYLNGLQVISGHPRLL